MLLFRPRRRSLAASLLMVAVLGNVGCSSQAQPPKPAPPATAASQAAATSATIQEVLRQWSAGKQDDAIRTFLELYDSRAPVGRLRPFHMTEQQFVELSPETISILNKEMPTTFQLLGQIAREVERRAKNAISEGNVAAAERLYRALEFLGAANRGPEVTLLADAVGKGIDRRAKAGLAALRAQASTQPADK